MIEKVPFDNITTAKNVCSICNSERTAIFTCSNCEKTLCLECIKTVHGTSCKKT